MNSERISDKQGICLVTLFILGTTLLIGLGSDAQNDAWLTTIIGAVITMPVLLIYSRLLYLFPNKDFYDILNFVLGKIDGKVVIIIYIWFCFHLSVLVLRNFSEFTNIVIFPDTPVALPSTFFIILCIFGVKAGIEGLGRCAELLIIVEVIIILIVSVGLSVTQMDIRNLLPVFYNGLKPIVSSSFSALTFPYAETVVFTMAFTSLKRKRSSYRIYFKGLLFGASIILISNLRNILILGGDTIARNYFPSYIAVSVIRLGDFVERVESTVIIVLIINVFIKLSIDILAVCKGIEKLFNLDDYRFIVTPVSLLVLTFSFFIYKSTMEMDEWAFKVWPYYSFPFEVILPVIILILAEIKLRRPQPAQNRCN